MSNKTTAKNAIDLLCNLKNGFRELEPHEKKNLAVVIAQEYNVPVYGKAFDLISCENIVDFSNLEDIRKNIDAITLYEVKSTNKETLSDSFNGYFFDLTTAELLVAQSLGKHFKFAFVNTIKETYKETDIQGVLSAAKKVYPKWAITLGPLP